VHSIVDPILTLLDLDLSGPAHADYRDPARQFGEPLLELRTIEADPQFAFPGKGQMKPEQLEIDRLRREVTKLKAERDILKKAAAYFAKEST